MGFADTVIAGVADVLAAEWNVRDGQVVPETEDVVLKNGAVRLQATYLYADLAGSSALAQKVKRAITAKVIRTYINSSARILRNYYGAIRSFDGDRVMAIFVGKDKSTSAVRAALAINWAVRETVWPQITAKWPDITTYYTMRHGIGIDTGEALVVRGGVRDNNDLISIGEAPNVAAKLSDIRSDKSIYITDRVYADMSAVVKTAKDKNMWTNKGKVEVGGMQYQVYGSSYHWKP